VADTGEGVGWVSADLNLAKLKQYRQCLPFLTSMLKR
jgi:hypothetical protein